MHTQRKLEHHYPVISQQKWCARELRDDLPLVRGQFTRSIVRTSSPRPLCFHCRGREMERMGEEKGRQKYQ